MGSGSKKAEFLIAVLFIEFLIMHVPVLFAYYGHISLLSSILISFLLLSSLLFTGVITKTDNSKTQNNLIANTGSETENIEKPIKVDIREWSPFDSPRSGSNFNVFVIGDTKSRVKYLDKYIDGRCCSNDSNLVFVLDYSGDLARLYPRYSIDVAKVGIKVDPFSFVDLNKKFSSEEDKEDYIDNCLVFIKDLVCALLDIEAGSLESSWIARDLKEYVFRYIGHNHKLTLNGLANELQLNLDSYKLGLRLEDAINDDSNILNGFHDVKVSSGIVVLNLSSVKDVRHKDFLTSYILSKVYLSIKAISPYLQKHIIVHDSWEIRGRSSWLLECIARKTRGLYGSLVCSGSSPLDFKDGRLSRVFNNSTWVCLFKQENNSIKALNEFGNYYFDSNEISNLKEGEYVMRGRGKSIFKGTINYKESS